MARIRQPPVIAPPVIVEVNKTNWRNFDGFTAPPGRGNYLRPGRKVISGLVLLGIVSEVNIVENFFTKEISHRYTLEAQESGA